MTRGLVMTASTRSSAPQWGQNRRSMSNTRRRRCIQFIGAQGVASPGCTCSAPLPGAVTLLWRVMMRWRCLALGANTP